MTVTPEEICKLPPEIWKRLAAGEDAVHIRTGDSDCLFRISAIGPAGGTVADLFRVLADGGISDDEEMEEFARNVEEGRKLMNQPLVSPWDT